MKKRFVLTLLLIASVTTIRAQTKIGFEAAIISSGYSGKILGQNTYTADKWGGRFGIDFDSKINTHIYIQTGLLYVMNGYMANSSKGDLSYSLNTLQIPLNVIYKSEKQGSHRMFIGIGPYFGINLFGTRKYSPADSTAFSHQLNVGLDPRDDIRYFDFGFGFTGGYELKSGLFVRVHYQIGLANQSELNDADNILKNKNSGIAIGYFIGNDKEKRAERRNRAFRNHGLEM